MLMGLTKDVGQSKLAEFFKSLDARLAIGVPDEIQVIEGIGVAYVTFPSVLAAKKFFEVIPSHGLLILVGERREVLREWERYN